MKHLLIALFFILQSRPVAALPPVELIREAIDVAPALEAARANVERAKATARRLSIGPYEITAQGGGGRRRVDNALNPDERFTEWQANVSRSVRLPGKRAVDKDLGYIEIAMAEADLAAARRAAQMTFTTLWSQWRSAYEAAAFALQTAQQAKALADAGQKGVEAGGARAVDVDQLSAWAGFYALEANAAEVSSGNAKAALQAAFPTLSLPAIPSPLTWDEAYIAELLLAQSATSPNVTRAELAADQAALTEQRARQNRIPDPTFGFQMTNEFGGQEKSFLASVSIPLSGRARAASAQEAKARSTSAAAQLRAAQLEAERRIDTAKRAARAALLSLKQAQEAQTKITGVLNRFEQGRREGGVSFTQVMTARRNFYDTQQALIARRIAAEQVLMELAVLMDLLLKP